MSRDGSNIYSAPAGTLAVSGTPIESAKYNAFVNDLVADANLARPVVAGGTGVTTAGDWLAAMGVTATAAELNKLDGVTASAAELNIMDGVTATAAELNILDGATLTVTELNYVDGVTSAIQTQLNNKVAVIADPGADRIRFWDDSAGAEAYLTAGAGLTISGTTITATNTGLTYLGTQSITSDATGIVTGLGGYRRIRVMGVSLVPSPSAVVRLRVGDAGGLLTTSIYRYTTGITTSFAMSGSTGSACSFAIEIDAFNTTDAIKAVREVGSESTDNRPVCVSSTAVFDRFGVFSSGGANGIASGTLYWWGEV